MKKTVLIIDDILSILQEMEQILNMEGYSVLKATDGYEAARCLEEEKLDLVITDLMMREMNGFEVISLVKTINSKLPIIVLSGQMEQKYIRKALQLEADLYLKKPCTADDLIQAVEKLLN